MSLYIFHRVLIAATIIFDAWFSVWCWQAWQATERSQYLALMIGSTVLSVAFILYLIYFNRKLRFQQHVANVTCAHCNYDLRGSIAAGRANCPECGKPIPDQARRNVVTN